MLNTLARHFRCLVFAFLLLTACGSSDTSQLVLIPTGPTSLRLGETLQLSSTDPVILWIVIGGDDYGTVDAFGLYQAPDTMPSDPSVVIRGEFKGSDGFAFIQLQP